MSNAAGIQITLAKHQDKLAWNTYIQGHPQATPYHNFGWLNSVELAYGHGNVGLIATQTLAQGSEIVGVLPAILMRIPFKGQILCSLPFCDVGYALADSNEVRDLLINDLRAKYGQDAKVEYRDSEHAIYSAELNGQKVRMLLQIPDSSAVLMAGFKSKLRSQIRKAEKNGLNYVLGSNQTLLDDFYQVFVCNMRKLGSPVHSKLWFQHLYEQYQNDMLISVVYKDKLPIGGGIVLLTANKACIPWASTLAEYNKLAPNMLLYWSILQHLSDNEYSQFDFGRSSFGEGTFKFKQQWGAEPVALNWHLPGDLPSPLNESDGTNNLRQLVETAWSYLPLSLTTWLGPKVRKYISL